MMNYDLQMVDAKRQDIELINDVKLLVLIRVSKVIQVNQGKRQTNGERDIIQP